MLEEKKNPDKGMAVPQLNEEVLIPRYLKPHQIILKRRTVTLKG